MKYYKLTDENYQTENNTQWGENVTHKAKGKGNNLCSEDVIHVYDHPLKAAMFNPCHANFSDPILWECRVKKVVANDKLAVGVKQCTTIRQIPLPEITTNQRVRFAILCALEVYHDEGFTTWANNWLSGKDRTSEAALKVAWAVATIRGAAAEAAESAVWAAIRAAWAARAAVEAVIKSAWTAAWSAEVSAWVSVWAAARAAVWAAESAVEANPALAENIGLVALIEKAIREESAE